MRKLVFLSVVFALVAVSFYGCDETIPTQPDTVSEARETPLLSAKFPVKTDGTCQVGQTVVWDGEAWACADMPPYAGDWQFQQKTCSIGPNATYGCIVYCTGNAKILGGGYGFATGAIKVTDDKPIWVEETKAWHVRATNLTGSAITFKTFALCAKIDR